MFDFNGEKESNVSTWIQSNISNKQSRIWVNARFL